jgi:hypothetical protein
MEKNVKMSLLLLLLVLLLIQSCKKLGLCEDGEFSFTRQPNDLTSLRLDGYYYGDLIGNNQNAPELYLLYQNGIFYNNRSAPIEDVVAGSVQLNNSETRKNHKGDWGIYKLDGNSIEIQSWTPSTSCNATFTQKGEILSQ